jgi:hypothetical protein
MKYISLYQEFNEEELNFYQEDLFESQINEMTMLRENCMANWDINKFFEFFAGPINESSLNENEALLLEKAYYTYEVGSLYEHKKEWFETKGDVTYLVDESSEEQRVIMFKDNKLHIISKNALDMITNRSLNEGFFDGMEDFLGGMYKKVKSTVKKYVTDPVKKAAKYVAKKVSSAWDALSNGAKKVWEFSKKIVSAVVVFVKENPLTAIGILLQIIGSILAFVPVANFLAPTFTLLAGGITVYEGVTNLIDAGKEVGKADKVKDIVKGSFKIILGSASLILGIKDLIEAAATALPGYGSVGVAIKTSVTSWSNNFAKTALGGVAAAGVGKALGCSNWIANFFVTLCEKAPFVQKLSGKAVNLLGKEVLSDVGKGVKIAAKGADQALSKAEDAVLDSYNTDIVYEGDSESSWGFKDLVVNFLCYVGKSCFSWLYDAVVAGISGVGSAIKGLLNLPSKISSSIEKFKEKQGGSFIGGIISGALSSAVKPMTDCASRFINDYIKPKVDPAINWMTSLGKNNGRISKLIEGNKELKSPVAGIKKQGPAPIKKANVEITDADKTNIKKIGTSGTETLVKSGGGSEKIVDKIKDRKEQFTEKFPGVSKMNGTWGQSPSGKSTYTYKSKKADGSVTLFNDGKYTVISGPNKGAKGEFNADKGVSLKEPKGGWKNNESIDHVLSFDRFSFIN